jgi:hypothetical protein
MLTCLLKRALPFTLTFIVGATVGGLFNLFGSGETKAVRFMQFQPYLEGHSCRAYRRNLVAETKPLLIRFKPDARWPHGLEAQKSDLEPVQVYVTFGADGKVSYVTPSGGCFSDSAVARLKPVCDAVEWAARRIQFEPEMVNGMPVTVTKEVEIHFMTD